MVADVDLKVFFLCQTFVFHWQKCLKCFENIQQVQSTLKKVFKIVFSVCVLNCIVNVWFDNNQNHTYICNTFMDFVYWEARAGFWTKKANWHTFSSETSSSMLKVKDQLRTVCVWKRKCVCVCVCVCVLERTLHKWKRIETHKVRVELWWWRGRVHSQIGSVCAKVWNQTPKDDEMVCVWMDGWVDGDHRIPCCCCCNDRLPLSWRRLVAKAGHKFSACACVWVFVCVWWNQTKNNKKVFNLSTKLVKRIVQTQVRTNGIRLSITQENAIQLYSSSFCSFVCNSCCNGDGNGDDDGDGIPENRMLQQRCWPKKTKQSRSVKGRRATGRVPSFWKSGFPNTYKIRKMMLRV